MRARTFKTAVVLVAILAFAGGILFERKIGTNQFIDWAGLRHWMLAYTSRNVSERTPVSWPTIAKGRTMVALVFGQSNAANGGETLAGERSGVYEFYRGRVYVARDPLLGADGNGGSVWQRFATQAIDRGMFDTVVLVPFAVGVSEIKRWAPGGSLHSLLLSVIDQARDAQLEFTHLLWHQGEADAMFGTNADMYQERFRSLLSTLRARGVTAPIYVARASRCGRHHPNDEIRRAQLAVTNSAEGVFAGPDTDTLGLGERYDGCHFSTEGLERAADLWLQAITH